MQFCSKSTRTRQRSLVVPDRSWVTFVVAETVVEVTLVQAPSLSASSCHVTVADAF